VTCGQETNGHARCPQCLEGARAQQALYKRRKGLAWQAEMREHWRREGRCTRCGRAPEPGLKKCSHCLAIDREALKRWKERHPSRPPDGSLKHTYRCQSCGHKQRLRGTVATRPCARCGARGQQNWQPVTHPAPKAR